MSDQWLTMSLNMIYQAAFWGDVTTKRQAAAVCLSIARMLDPTLPILVAAPPPTAEAPPLAAEASDGGGDRPPTPETPGLDLEEMGSAVMAAIATKSSLDPLVAKYGPQIVEYRRRAGLTQPPLSIPVVPSYR